VDVGPADHGERTAGGEQHAAYLVSSTSFRDQTLGHDDRFLTWYVKAKDEITATLLPVKARKDRYAGAVHQVAVRSLHEIFEADRSGKIHSIALMLGTEAVSPATGLPEAIPLVIVAADRETFSLFDLTNVVPRATLDHLGAAVSRSPFDLTPADTSHGVRARRQ
jgi:restriction system protein